MTGFLLNAGLIVIAAAAILLARAARHGSKGAGMAAAVCTGLTLLLAFLKILPHGQKDEMQDTRQSYEHVQQICGAFIGAQLAATHPGARVVLLTAPQREELPEGVGHTVLVEHLKKVLENQGLQVTLHPLDVPEDLLSFAHGNNEHGMAREFLMLDTSSWFDSRRLALVLAELAPRADLVVATVDVAGSLGPESLPRSGQGPGLVLLNAQVDQVRAVLNQTVLQAVLLPRNDPEVWKPGAQIPEELEAAFNRRFLWVTRENAAVLGEQGLLP